MPAQSPLRGRPGPPAARLRAARRLFAWRHACPEVRFGAASTVTRRRLAGDSPSLPYPFAVGPSSPLEACIIGPRAASAPTEPWALFGPTDFAITGSNSRGDAEAAILRIEVAAGDLELPTLRASTYPASGTANKVVIPMGSQEIIPIPFPIDQGKLSVMWRPGCAIITGAMPAGLSARIATAADAAAYNGANPGAIEEGGTCVIVGTPSTATDEAELVIEYLFSHSNLEPRTSNLEPRTSNIVESTMRSRSASRLLPRARAAEAFRGPATRVSWAVAPGTGG